MLRVKSRQFSAASPAFNPPHVPSLAVTPFEFFQDFRRQKTRIPVLLLYGVVCMIQRLAVSVEHRFVTDGQMHDDS